MRITELLEADEPQNPSRRRFMKTAGAAAAQAAMPGGLVKSVIQQTPAAVAGSAGVVATRAWQIAALLMQAYKDASVKSGHSWSEEDDETNLKKLVQVNTRFSQNTKTPYVFLYNEPYLEDGEECRQIIYYLKPDGSYVEIIMYWILEQLDEDGDEYKIDEFYIADESPESVPNLPDSIKMQIENEVNRRQRFILSNENSNLYFDFIDKIVDMAAGGHTSVATDNKKSNTDLDKTADTVATTATRSAVSGQMSSGLGARFLRKMIDKLVDLAKDDPKPTTATQTPDKPATPALPAPVVNPDDIITQMQSELGRPLNDQEKAVVRQEVSDKNKESK